MPKPRTAHPPGWFGVSPLKGPTPLAGAAILIPNSIDDLITVNEAATLCGVTAAAIRQWASRNLIAAAGLDERGRKLYRLIDIAKAEKATRTRARRCTCSTTDH